MIEVVDSNAVYYYHFDGLGSVVALSDSNGDSCQSYEYTVYGQVAAEDPNHPNPYMFTGQRFDIETGLYYYRARCYNPHVGRFMQTDPVGYSAGVNWYLYCRNNPLGHVDPSGLWTMDANGPNDCNSSNGVNNSVDDPDWKVDSWIASGLLWGDTFGIIGKRGVDVFDFDYAWDFINYYPKAGPEWTSRYEKFWAWVHREVGRQFGLWRMDPAFVEDILWTWEATEPLIPIFNPLGQGRDRFEGGEKGWLDDIDKGMEGYWWAITGHRPKKKYIEKYICPICGLPKGLCMCP